MAANTMTPGARAVYDVLSDRKGVLDDIDEDTIIELCEDTSAAVLATVSK
ncbi:MAG TPA: hypothetical protein VGR71_05010 [Nitrospira sp.]|nr:hypothetical protein [Nitrospira sp.]